MTSDKTPRNNEVFYKLKIQGVIKKNRDHYHFSIICLKCHVSTYLTQKFLVLYFPIYDIVVVGGNIVKHLFPFPNFDVINNMKCLNSSNLYFE